MLDFLLFLFIPDNGFVNFLMELKFVVVLYGFRPTLVIFDLKNLESLLHHFYMFLCILELFHCQMIIVTSLNLASSIIGGVGFLLHLYVQFS